MAYDGDASHLAPLAIAIPILVAAVLLAVGRHLPRRAVDIVATGAAVLVVAVDAVLLVATTGGRVITWSGGWTPHGGFSVGIVLVAEPTNAGLALIAAALIGVALLFSWRYFEDVHGHFQALMLLFLAGMGGFALSGDLFDMFVFFELMGAVAYALTGFKVEDPTAVQGGVNFGIINSLGAYISLSGIGMLYARTGQLGLPQLSEALSGHPPDALVVAAFVFIVTGFLVKAAMVPFHFWLADAHAVAPTPVCVLFSGVMVELGVYGAARVYWVVFSGTLLPGSGITHTFLVLGVLTAALGAVMCFAQRHLKRLLAYSTVAHVGLFLVAFATLDGDGTAGAALYVAGHAAVKSALFLLCGVLLNRYGNIDEFALHGRGRDARLVSWLFLVGAFALAGLPPFGIALGKSVAEDALTAAGFPWGPAVFVLVSAVTGGAVIRAGLGVFFGLGHVPGELRESGVSSGEEEPETDQPVSRAPATMVTAIGVLLAGGLAVGVVPGSAPAIGTAAERFIDRAGYVSQALHNATALPIPPPPAVHWTWLGVGLGLLSAALGLGLALLALHTPRLPAALRRTGHGAIPVLRGLRRVHSGHVGDYVAWLFTGVAALGALVGLPLW